MTIPLPDHDDSFILPKNRLTNRQYCAIGRVSATWAVLEFLMEKTLSKLALAPSLLGYVLTDKLGPDNRISAIKSLVGVHRTKYEARIVAEEVLDAIEVLLKSVERMKSERNHVVHSVWVKAGDDHMHRTTMSAAARSGATFTSGDAERVSDIETFSESIQRAADRLSQLAHLIPEIDSVVMQKLHVQEIENRRKPFPQSTLLVPRRSYTRLGPDFGPVDDKPKKKQRESSARSGAKKN